MIHRQKEQGFVLATSLVMLMLMTMLVTVIYMSIDSSRKSTAAAESSTEAFYYAETAANYMSWALYNNAEFDSYVYPSQVKTTGEFTFGEPDVRTGDLPNPQSSGDFDEWKANRGNPSGNDRVVKPDGTVVKNAALLDAFGQLMYYDNSALAGRMVWLQNRTMFSQGGNGFPTMYEIHTKLPRYIMLSIDPNDGSIVPSLPPVNAVAPWHNDVEGVDYPTNGAVVWLTGGNRTDDYQLAPTDNFFAPVFTIDAVGVVTYDPSGAYGGAFPCNPNAALSTSIACSSTGTWLTDADYGLVIYAIGYVGGKPQKLVRVVYKE